MAVASNRTVIIINFTVNPVKETECCFDKSFLKRGPLI